MGSEASCLTVQFTGFYMGRFDLFFLDIDCIDVRKEKNTFGQEALLADRAHIIHQRQQHHWRVSVA